MAGIADKKQERRQEEKPSKKGPHVCANLCGEWRDCSYVIVRTRPIYYSWIGGRVGRRGGVGRFGGRRRRDVRATDGGRDGATPGESFRFSVFWFAWRPAVSRPIVPIEFIDRMLFVFRGARNFYLFFFYPFLTNCQIRTRSIGYIFKKLKECWNVQLQHFIISLHETFLSSNWNDVKLYLVL